MKKALVIMIIVIGLFAFYGCSDGSFTDSDLVGTWQVVSYEITMPDGTVAEADFRVDTFVFEENNQYTVSSKDGSFVDDGEWILSEASLTLMPGMEDETMICEYSIVDNELTLNFELTEQGTYEIVTVLAKQ